MDRIRLIGFLVWKDIQLVFSDHRAALFGFLVPILLASVFGMIFDGPNKRTGKVKLPLLVIKEDQHQVTDQIVDDLKASPNIDCHITDRRSAEKEIERRRYSVAVIFPEGFGQQTIHQLQSGKKPKVELLYHPLGRMESEWAEGLLTECILRRFAKEWLSPLGLVRDIPLEKPFEITRESIPQNSSHAFHSYSHSFCGMTLQYLLFWGMESGLLFLRERNRGIWNRVRMAPLGFSIPLFSRVLSTTLIGLCQIGITFLFGYVVFDVSIQGSFGGFLLLSLAISLFAAVTGLLVATLSGTEARARNACILVILTVSMLGGLWLPLFLLPHWVQELSLSLPTTWAMNGLDGVTWQGDSLDSIVRCVGVVFLFTSIFFIGAWIRFVRRERHARRGGIA